MTPRPQRLVAPALAAALALLPGCRLFGPKPAKVNIKFVIFDNDNTFAATVYAQEVGTGRTIKYAYGPHLPYLSVDLPQAGTYVFYARLVEAPDDYHYGFTGYRADAYGHMTRGGTRDPGVNLIGLDVKPGGTYKVYISDHWAELPEPGKPVSVPWHREQPS
jgi:hypothetical protein